MKYNIRLELDYNYVIEPIKTKIVFNGEIVYNGIIKDMFEFIVESNDDDCELQVHLINKPYGSTVIKDNKIAEDTYIEVTNITINDMKMRHQIFDAGTSISYTGDTIPNAGNIFCEGYYSFKFTSPLTDWMRSKYPANKVSPLAGEIRRLLNE